MNVLIVMKQIVFSLRRNILRSVLVLLGIVWGTLAVILLQSIGDGFYSASEVQINSIENGLVYVFPGTTSKPFEGLKTGRAILIHMSEIRDLKKEVNLIASWSPQMTDYSSRSVLRYEHKTRGVVYSGVAPGYFSTESLSFEKGGRNFTENEMAHRGRVCVVGYKLKSYLFGQENPRGSIIYLSGIPLRVVGVIDKKTGGYAASQASMTLYLPYTTYIDMRGDRPIDRLLLLPKKKNQAAELIQALRVYFANKFHFAVNDKSAVNMPSLAEASHFFNGFFFAIELFLLFAGSMTLAVGGVGVANIMYLIVEERTFEIGLQIALGAQDGFVMLQILLEALVLVLVGGGIGYLLSNVIIAVMGYLPLPSWIGHPYISLRTTIVTVIVLMLVALIAGWFPARKASKLDPVYALGG